MEGDVAFLGFGWQNSEASNLTINHFLVSNFIVYFLCPHPNVFDYFYIGESASPWNNMMATSFKHMQSKKSFLSLTQAAES